MREPPPTPVNPTSRPTARPETAKTGSMPCNICNPGLSPESPMLIKLLDFVLGVNHRRQCDLPSPALSKRKISAASHDQRRAEQGGGCRPIAKNHDAGNDHPDQL